MQRFYSILCRPDDEMHNYYNISCLKNFNREYFGVTVHRIIKKSRHDSSTNSNIISIYRSMQNERQIIFFVRWQVIYMRMRIKHKSTVIKEKWEESRNSYIINKIDLPKSLFSKFLLLFVTAGYAWWDEIFVQGNTKLNNYLHDQVCIMHLKFPDHWWCCTRDVNLPRWWRCY